MKPTPTWLDLFDAAYVENVVDVVRDDMQAQHLAGYRPRLQVPLRDELQRMIDAYTADNVGTDKDGNLRIERDDIEAAFRLYVLAGDLAERVEGHSIRDADPGELANRWFEFIAKAAGHHIYSGIPAASVAQSKRGTAGNLNRWGDPARVEVDAIIQKLKRARAWQGLSAAELWDRFFGDLDAAQLDPKLDGDAITYQLERTRGRARIALKTFKNRLRK